MKNLLYCLKGIIIDNVNISFFTVALFTLLFCKYFEVYNTYWIEPYIIIGCQLVLLFFCYKREQILQTVSSITELEKLNKTPNKYIETKVSCIIKSASSFEILKIEYKISNFAVIIQFCTVIESRYSQQVFDHVLIALVVIQAIYLICSYFRLKKYIYDYLRYLKENTKEEENV